MWLLLSAFITVPWMFMLLIGQPQGGYGEYDYNGPRWSPGGSQIVYVNRGIWAMDASGFPQTRLVEERYANCPAWSPDGKQIAYFVDGTSGLSSGSLWVMGADGSKATRLADARSNGSGIGACPSWSPDGSRIAYWTDPVHTPRADDPASWSDSVYTIRADGSDRITLGTGQYPSWSPDGSRIYIPQGVLVNPDGSGRIKLPDSFGDISWSPDGKRLATASGHLYMVDVDGSGRTAVEGLGGYVVLSPDGKHIAYSNGSALHVVSVDGSGSRQVSSRLSVFGAQKQSAWRPDGRGLAYPCRTGFWPFSTGDICIVSADGRDDRDLTQSGQLGWTFALLAPALVHLVLLIGLMSPLLYVRRHSQQALLIALLRTMAPLALFLGLQTDLGPWALVNGSLWLFGSVWGFRQVARGDCWLMRVRGEGGQLPRPWAIARPAPQEVAAPDAAPDAATMPAAQSPDDARAALDLGLAFLAQGRQHDAVGCFTRAFQQGDAGVRRLALAELDKLGQVQRG